MSFPGKQSFGGEVNGLRDNGIYRYSRNLQLVGGFLFICGYAMLWPSLSGSFWAGLWLVISHLMVRGEEIHLKKVFGDEFSAYCERTPRYLGFPKKWLYLSHDQDHFQCAAR
ncbi:methyltransferase family protein [Chloroflexota bacterium]